MQPKMLSHNQRKNRIDYLLISQDSMELFNHMTEYLKLIGNYDEPENAKKLRLQAEGLLVTNDIDYERVLQLIDVATKIGIM